MTLSKILSMKIFNIMTYIEIDIHKTLLIIVYSSREKYKFAKASQTNVLLFKIFLKNHPEFRIFETGN